MVAKKHGITDCEIGDDLKCVHCGFQFRRATQRRECPVIQVDKAALAAKRLSWASRLSNYAEALAKWFKAGRPRRQQTRIDELLETCKGCEKYRNGACSSCGCRVNSSGIGVVNKLAMATEACPIGKWSADYVGDAQTQADPKTIRVGFVLPCLMLGGVESWLWSIIRHWGPESGVAFSGVALTSGSLSPEMVSLVNALGPVVAPFESAGVTQAPTAIDAIQSIGKVSDVLVIWGIGADAVMTAKASGARVVGVAHACREWWTPQAEHVDHWVSVHEVAAGSIPPGKPYDVIGNGVDVERCQSTLTRTEARERLGLPATAKVYGYVGRFSSAGEKRITQISEAIRHLPEDWWGVMVGSGRAVPTPHERLIVAPATRSIGDVWRAVDVGVIASEHESWCLAADEIHAAKRPLVSTRVGAIVDATEWLPQPPTAQDIAAACQRAYGRPVPGLRPERTSAAMAAAWAEYLRYITSQTR